MTNQVNQAFEKWAMQYYGETVMSVNPPQHYAHPNEYMLDTYRNAYEGWQARESEINSLKQRVDELQADNLRLRDALEESKNVLEIAMTDRDGNKFVYLNTRSGSMLSALDTLDKCNKALSSTPAQSLAEHDNATIDRCKNIVADDALAITFQSMGAYRSAIIKHIGELKATPTLNEKG